MSDQGTLGVKVRAEAPHDHDAIRELTARAFEGLSFSDGSEPRVIDDLRQAKALALSLVAVRDGRVVGHVAFSRVEPASVGAWYALGPVSVEPTLQRRGLGSLLIKTGLQALRDDGALGCVLLGSPAYYCRFGFTVEPELAPPCLPSEHFQVLAFTSTPLGGRVGFHRAFGASE